MAGEPLHTDLSATPAESLPVVCYPAESASATRLVKTLLHRTAWRKLLLFAISLFLFVFAITTMKEGAHGLAPIVEDHFAVDDAFNSLGFGWLFAYLVMSGSPVAASALTFFDAGIIDKLGAYTMITGSRLGASFIVLLLGFLYVLKGRNKAESLGIGLLSLCVTGTTYVISLGLGWIFLTSGFLDDIQFRSGALISSATDLLFDPVTHLLLNVLPRWSLFLIGLAIILLSFSLFDRCLPQITLNKSEFGRISRLIYRPWVMFLVGGLITLISMSVSVSIGILVPLSARGFVRRENLVSYIMGANITTFIDTLLAAVLLQNPAAFTIVLVEMVSIALISLALLVSVYHRYERGVLSFTGRLMTSNRNLGFFMIIVFTLPIILMLL